MTEPTEEEVAAQLAETEAFAESLEAAVLSGDTTITHEELTRTKSLAGFLRLQVEGARKRAEDAREKRRTDAVKALHDATRKRVAQSGTKLNSLATAVETAAKEFIEEAALYDGGLSDIRAELHSLQILDGQSEQGIGLNGVGQIIVDGTTFDIVDGPKFLGLIFEPAANAAGVPD